MLVYNDYNWNAQPNKYMYSSYNLTSKTLMLLLCWPGVFNQITTNIYYYYYIAHTPQLLVQLLMFDLERLQRDETPKYK